MTKVSVVLYYWIAIMAALLFSKARGLADNDGAVIKIVIVVSVIYAIIVFVSYSWGKSKARRQEERQRNRSAKYKNDKRGSNR